MTSGVSTRGDEGPLSVTTDITAERTVVVVENTRDVAVVVNSASGERVYLPPEGAVREDDAEPTAQDDSPYDGVPSESPYEGIPADSPYEGIADDGPYDGLANDSPYEGIPADSPYEGLSNEDDEASTHGSEPTYGVVPTERGVRIVHPEPATDVRFLR
ncbi:MAG: hypothetical protein ABEI98_06950 [Halorhabdus sp.]